MGFSNYLPWAIRPATEQPFDIDLDMSWLVQEVALDLGKNAEALGLTLDSPHTLDVLANLEFAFSFGFDLDNWRNPADAFFIRPGRFALGIEVEASEVNLDARLGPLSLEVNDASLDVDARLEVLFPQETFTLATLGTLVDQIEFDMPRAEFEAVLPTRVAIGDTVLVDDLIITLTAHLFENIPDDTAEPVFNQSIGEPEVSFNQSIEDLLNFGHLTPENIVRHLRQFADWLDEFSGTNLLDVQIPFTGGRTLGDALEFKELILGQVLPALEDDDPGSPSTPSFTTIQDLVGIFQDIGILNTETMLGDHPVRYDANTGELTIDLHLTRTIPAQTWDVVFDVDLSPVAAFETDSQIEAGAEVDFQFTLGFDLSRLTQSAGSSNGSMAPWLFVRDVEFTGELQLSAEVNAAAHLAEFLQISIVDGTLTGVPENEAEPGPATLTIQARLDNHAHNQQGQLSLSEMWASLSDVASLVESAAIQGDARLTLPVRVEPDFLDEDSDPTIQVDWQFEATADDTVTVHRDELRPDFNDDFNDLLDIGNFNPRNVLAMLEQFCNWLATLDNSPLFATAIPLTDGQTLGDLADLKDFFCEEILPRLQQPGDPGTPSFQTVQQLAQQLADPVRH